MEGNISSEEHGFPTEDKRKDAIVYMQKAQEGSFTQQIKVVNSQLGLVCPSQVCVCRYSRWLSCGKLENQCKFVTSLVLQNSGFWWIAFPKRKIQKPQKLAFVTVYWTQHKPAWPPVSQCPGILQWSRRVLGTRGKGGRQALASHLCTSTARPAQSVFFHVRSLPFLFQEILLI